LTLPRQQNQKERKNPINSKKLPQEWQKLAQHK